MLYFTADLHFYHDKIIRHIQRPFANADVMNRILIKNWNASISLDDEVYILGDVTMKGAAFAHDCLSALNGTKHLIRGNHDNFIDSPHFDRSLFASIQDYFLEHDRIRDWALWTIGVSLGLRISDLLSLKIGNLLNNDRTFRSRLYVTEQKTSKLNNCLITPSVVNAATKLFKIMDNLDHILAIELMNAAQGIEFRRPARTSPVLEKFLKDYRKEVPFIDEDIIMYTEIHRTVAFIRRKDFVY